jgi:hypothetical protein
MNVHIFFLRRSQESIIVVTTLKTLGSCCRLKSHTPVPSMLDVGASLVLTMFDDLVEIEHTIVDMSGCVLVEYRWKHVM